MKKYIKIFCVIAFILLVSCIATSFAKNEEPTVDFGAERLNLSTYKEQNGDFPTSDVLLDALDAGKTLTGISAKVKDQTINLLCRERHWAIYSTGVYESAGDSVTFPGIDSNGNGKFDEDELEENGYAKAYILAAPGYVKNDTNYGDVTSQDERQYAWYFILGQTDSGRANDLFNIAIAYQTYKKEEKDVKVTVNPDADTIESGEKSIYGPIKIEYSYAKSQQSVKSDEWGGFNYAFFDEDGNNISDRVQLCTLSNSEYTPITFTEIESDDETNGYYKVRENTYNNVELYVVTQDKSVSTIKLKIQENRVDYTATIYPIRGEHHKTYYSQILCSSCSYEVEGANKTTSMKEAVTNSNMLLQVDNKYYTFNGTTTEVVGWTSGDLPTHVYRVGNTDYDASDLNTTELSSVDTKYCNWCGSYHPSAAHFQRGNDGLWWCLACHSNYCGNDATHPAHTNAHACNRTSSAAIQNHFISSHMTDAKKYTRSVYNFVEFDGCGKYMGEKCSDCGTYLSPGYYNSQGLHIIESAETKSSNELKLDIEIELSKRVEVTKQWEDNNAVEGTRPESITVKLLAKKGNKIEETGQTRELNESNGWYNVFEDLERIDANGNEIEYTVEEITPITGYESQMSGNEKDGFVITNRQKTEVQVIKQWEDEDDLDEYRPESIVVTLYANGVSTGKTVTLRERNSWSATFDNLFRYDNGKLINYTVQEEVIDEYETPVYTKTEQAATQNSLALITYTITNTHEPNYDGYIEIKGTVWNDGEAGKSNDINGTLGEEDSRIEGIKVTLRDANGRIFDVTSTATTDSNGNYTIKVNYDNSHNVYKLYENAETVMRKLSTAYVEFEYDAMKYTTVKYKATNQNTSKAVENTALRTQFDNAHSTRTPSTTSPEKWRDKNITASTQGKITLTSYPYITTEYREEVIKYCYGNGKLEHTHPEGAWNDVITNGLKPCENCKGTGHTIRTYNIQVLMVNDINLGLFEREQPKVRIVSDISKVEVEMQNQRYTYLFGQRTEELLSNGGLTLKYENKETHEYRYLMNPSNIAYLNDGHDEAMSVKVTYEVQVGNLSTTLPVTVHNIINCYENEYEVESIKMGDRTINYTVIGSKSNPNYYSAIKNEQAKGIVLNGLDINIQPQAESEVIEITYSVSLDALKGLLTNEKETLNNEVEIQSYSTLYGENTLYAEQTTGRRTNKPYAGYDYESQPGNANIFINEEGKLEATKPEPDTDISPSFEIKKSPDPKVISGNVWEDTDSNGSDNLRLGDGKKSENEKNIENVVVQLFKVKDDGILEPAYIYHRDANATGEPIKKLAITKTDDTGYYSFGSNADGFGVVTDAYVIKFTYGDGIIYEDESYSTTIDGASVNARNYKSTIITEENINVYDLFKETNISDEWHLNANKGYSIAVDDMEERVKIGDLQYSNFDNSINMTAYSKPFKMQLEFDPSTSKTSIVSSDGKTIFGDELNIFDFGIVERAREDIFVETTAENIKVTLANGTVLTEGNPNTRELNYAKAIGFNQTINNGTAARNALEKQITVEVDTEIIQGATLELKYAVKVTNNSETDYDYYIGEVGDGMSEFNPDNLRTEYYYYGTNNEASPEITSSINYFIDYIDAELKCNWDNERDWEQVKASELHINGQEFISDETLEIIEEGKYIAYATTKFSELAPGETMTEYLNASKLLSNQDENTYDNHAEILKIDAKTARTIKETGKVKQYKMGNYVPSLATRKTNNDINHEEEGLHEQDDDRLKVIITPPTGIVTYITYIVAVLMGLIIIATGVTFIKKKVLIK